jgi:hypothetical protein
MRRFLLPFVLVAGLLVPVAAQAANPVYSAAKRSANAKSSTMQIRTATTVPGVGTVVATGSGAQRGQSVKLSMRSSAAGVTFSMHVIGLLERGHFVMYMRSPLFDAQLPPGKDWVRFDLQKQGEKVGIDFSSLLGSSQAMAPLWHGLVSTTSLGRASVAGRPAKRYRAHVDYQRAAAALPAFAKQLAAIERTTGVRVGRVTADVWVGSDGYVRRFRTTTPTVVNGARATSVQTITYTAYNVPVSIVAPSRATVLDFPG